MKELINSNWKNTVWINRGFFKDWKQIKLGRLFHMHDIYYENKWMPRDMIIIFQPNGVMKIVKGKYNIMALDRCSKCGFIVNASDVGKCDGNNGTSKE